MGTARLPSGSLASSRLTCCAHKRPGVVGIAQRLRQTRCTRLRGYVDKDLDWEADAQPRAAQPPSYSSPIRQPSVGILDWLEWPFKSRRNVMITLVGGTFAYWAVKQRTLPTLYDKPDIPFNLVGYTDVAPEDFVYMKTPGGHWVAAARDKDNRTFLIDEIGDLYYDSGDKDIGLYAVDTKGDLYNFYEDERGERQVVKSGNIANLKEFKISEFAGIKLDRDVKVVAFGEQSNTEIPAEAGLNGQLVGPGELVEGVPVPEGLESLTNELFFPKLNPQDARSFSRQSFSRSLIDDPDLPGFQPLLPDGVTIESLADDVRKGR